MILIYYHDFDWLITIIFEYIFTLEISQYAEPEIDNTPAIYDQL